MSLRRAVTRMLRFTATFQRAAGVASMRGPGHGKRITYLLSFMASGTFFRRPVNGEPWQSGEIEAFSIRQLPSAMSLRRPNTPLA